MYANCKYKIYQANLLYTHMQLVSLLVGIGMLLLLVFIAPLFQPVPKVRISYCTVKPLNFNNDQYKLNYSLYISHPKSSRIDQNFRTSYNQNFMKICSPPFETMLILNPKVGTMPRKFEKCFRSTNRPAQSSPQLKIVFLLACA